MSWDAHLVAPEEEAGFGPGTLGARVGPFLAWQAARWPRLEQALAALIGIRSRALRVGGRQVLLQFNPGRAVSSTAAVDTGSVAARPCFLCPGALPSEERGLPFGADWVLLANPAPILPDHLVLAHREHRPQAVGDALDALVELALATAGRLAAIYNGPACGASAPDHLHLQAVAAGLLPEEAEGWAAAEAGRAGALHTWAIAEPGRGILGFSGPAGAVRRALGEAVAVLAGGEALGPAPGAPGIERPDRGGGEPHGEPRLNLLCAARGGRVLALLFPRAAHRPACFFAAEPARRIVSPGALDMAGALVTVRESDFLALDQAAVEGLYREVTPAPERLRSAYREIERKLAHV